VIRAYPEGLMRLMNSQTFKVPLNVISAKAHMMGVERGETRIQISHENCYIAQVKRIVAAFDMRLPIVPITF